MKATEEERPNWLTLAGLSERNPYITHNKMRWWLTNREKNGLDAVVRKVGTRWFVDEQKFFAWLDGRFAKGK